MHRQRKTTKRAKPDFTTVYTDGQGGEIRYHFELECLEALLDGQRVGYPRCETDGIGMLSEVRLARAGVRLGRQAGE